MSDQKIKIIGTKGYYESDQKDRGIRINIDDENIEHPNPYFCHMNSDEFGLKEWQGYGIDSIKTFLSDVSSIIKGQSKVSELMNIRPTIGEASLISTYIIESAHASLDQKNTWIDISTN